MEKFLTMLTCPYDVLYVYEMSTKQYVTAFPSWNCRVSMTVSETQIMTGFHNITSPINFWGGATVKRGIPEKKPGVAT